MPKTPEDLERERSLREKTTEIRKHVRAIVDDLAWDIDDGLRVREQDILNAHTVEVCVRGADGTIVWKRRDFLKKD